ncbi:hypothetical protein M422DRAFT_23111 [Sphaerobolus stellatus SS14]|nr:hypothetical protein M422DRAFT_23111 [Sphaerobolus stellatus SS14]
MLFTAFVRNVLAVQGLFSVSSDYALPSTQSPNPNDLNPYPTKPRLTFNPDGTFKIVVFSDMHHGGNLWYS